MAGKKGRPGPPRNLNSVRLPWRTFWRRRVLRVEDRWILPTLGRYMEALKVRQASDDCCPGQNIARSSPGVDGFYERYLTRRIGIRLGAGSWNPKRENVREHTVRYISESERTVFTRAAETRSTPTLAPAPACTACGDDSTARMIGKRLPRKLAPRYSWVPSFSCCLPCRSPLRAAITPSLKPERSRLTGLTLPSASGNSSRVWWIWLHLTREASVVRPQTAKHPLTAPAGRFSQRRTVLLPSRRRMTSYAG